MKIKYYNELKNRNGSVTTFQLNGGPAYMANFQEGLDGTPTSKIFGTMEDADREMKRHGYKREPENEMTAEQIRGCIKVSDETFKQAFATLREILDEKEPRRPYYLSRLLNSLNLCSEICRNRTRLEYDLQKAIQAGR